MPAGCSRLGEILTCKSGKRAKLTLAANFSDLSTTVAIVISVVLYWLIELLPTGIHCIHL